MTVQPMPQGSHGSTQPPPSTAEKTGKPRYLLVASLAGTLGVLFGCSFGMSMGGETSPTASAPSATAPQAPAKKASERQWAKVVKDPAAHAGERYIVFGEVTQFDSATGADIFRADTAYKDTSSSGYFNGANTVMRGKKDDLSDVLEKDIFEADVTVLGTSKYKTMMGGRTVVPELSVETIKVIGRSG